MASSGIVNFQRNWQGSDHQTTVKKTVNVYVKTETGFQSAGALSIGTEVTYIDSLTNDHLRAAFRTSGGEVVYGNVDYFVKPKSAQAQATSLGPSSFGLSSRTFFSVVDYYNNVTRGLISRNDIPGELFDYLNELLDYVDNGYGNYNEIRMNEFPWGQIQNFYAEVIGPIACVKNRDGLLNNVINTAGLGGASIVMPQEGASVYDYKLLVGDQEYMISAKSASAISNQVKPQFVIPVVRNKLSATLLGSTAYKLINALADYSIKQGAFYGWRILQNGIELTDAAISDMEANYAPKTKKSSDMIVNSEAWKPFLKKYFGGRENVSYGEVRFKCESLIENASRSGVLNQNLKQIFNVYLNESRIIYVKLDINKRTGVPTFSASAGGGTTLVRNLYLRTSNYAERTADRIGFQVS